MRTAAILVAVTVGLGGCTTRVVSTPDGSPEPAPTVTVTVGAPGDDRGGDDSTASGQDDGTPAPVPTNTVQPGAAAPASVASLEVVQPEELGVALVAVDDSTGTVSWFDGFGWESFDVDAALGAQDWATDGRGGLLVQDEAGTIWHLAPHTDESILVVDAPPSGIQSRLVGGGLVNGAPHALVEQGTLGTPEDTIADLVAYDLEGRNDVVLIDDVSGWESGIFHATVLDRQVVLGYGAEGTGFVFVDDIDTGDSTTLLTMECCGIVTGGGERYGTPTALALIQPRGGPEYPWTLYVHALHEYGWMEITPLPQHDADWRRVTFAGDQVLASAHGTAVVQAEVGGWASLDLTVPGVVAVADDLPVG